MTILFLVVLLVTVTALSNNSFDLALKGFQSTNTVEPAPEPAPEPSEDGGSMIKVLFDADVVEAYGARCLDGSPAGYYFQAGTEPNKVAFWLQGGGLCIEAIDCIERSKGDLGSSSNWAATFTDDSNVLSDDPEVNPFANWTHVYVPYCSGDVFIGVQNSKDIWGLYFAGHLILDAIVDQLLNSSALYKATDVLLSGYSAGGIGVLQNADWLTDKLSAVAPRARVVASPQGGYYFPSEDLVLYPEFGLDITTPFAELASAYLYDWFVDPFLDASCTEAHPKHPHQCWSASVHYPYIKTPLFLAQNRFDSNQIGSVLGLDWWPIKNATQAKLFKQYFGAKMRAGLQQVLDSPKQDGLFLISCYEHTSNLCMKGGSRIDGVTYAEALYDWYQQGSRYPHQLVDSCPGPDPCNTYCSC